MADTVPETKQTVEVVEKEVDKKAAVIEKSETVVENGDVEKNGNAEEKPESEEESTAKSENGDVKENGTKDVTDGTGEIPEVCGIKRKSEVGLDSTDGIEDKIEKKQKTEESVEPKIVEAVAANGDAAEATA